MSVRTINLHDHDAVAHLTDHFVDFKIDEEMGRSIHDAVKTLQGYKETVELTPTQVIIILNDLNISDTSTPNEMNNKLTNSKHAYIIRKKFFNAHISKKKFESALFEIIMELAQSVSGNVLHAIVSLVKNFSLICLESNDMSTLYKELCFKFFCRDKERKELLILIINLDYGLKNRELGLFSRFISFVRFGLHLSFFGAVVRTSLYDDEEKVSEEDRKSTSESI
jgi:hypothetical protein